MVHSSATSSSTASETGVSPSGGMTQPVDGLETIVLDDAIRYALQRVEDMDAELYMARQLQQSLLPESLPDLPKINPKLSFQISRTHIQQTISEISDNTLAVHGCYIPCDSLGGDFYDIIHQDDGSISLLLADVSGHGVTAGFVTAIIKALFHQVGQKQSSPAALLTTLNNHLAKILKTGAYATAVAIHLSPNADGTMTLRYSNAGHPYPYLWRPTGDTNENGEPALSLERLEANGMALAWFAGMTYPEVGLTLEKGQRLLIYTDGTPEMVDPAGKIFTEDAFELVQKAHLSHDDTPTLDFILQDLSDFACGTPLNDDLTMVLIEVD